MSREPAPVLNRPRCLVVFSIGGVRIFRGKSSESELFAQDPVFFLSNAYFNGVEGNPETWCFFLNPGNFGGGVGGN